MKGLRVSSDASTPFQYTTPEGVMRSVSVLGEDVEEWWLFEAVAPTVHLPLRIPLRHLREGDW